MSRYEPGRRDLVECRYNQNEGYVVFSAMGSFFIPMAVMIYVYIRISCVVAKRHDNLKEIEVHKVCTCELFVIPNDKQNFYYSLNILSYFVSLKFPLNNFYHGL